MAVLGECRVVWNLLIDAKAGEPAQGQMHPQLFDQPAFAGDSVEIPDQQNAKQQVRIDRWPAVLTVKVLQLLTDKGESDMSVDES